MTPLCINEMLHHCRPHLILRAAKSYPLTIHVASSMRARPKPLLFRCLSWSPLRCSTLSMHCLRYDSLNNLQSATAFRRSNGIVAKEYGTEKFLELSYVRACICSLPCIKASLPCWRAQMSAFRLEVEALLCAGQLAAPNAAVVQPMVALCHGPLFWAALCHPLRPCAGRDFLHCSAFSE